MDFGALLVVLALALLTALYIFRPLVERPSQQGSPSDSRLSALEARYDQTLDAISELDMDAALGKVLQEDYANQRSMLMRRGAAVLRDLDALQGSGSGEVEPSPAEPEDLEAKLEEAVASLRERFPEQDERHCSQCGKPVLSSDRFCVHCGSLLHAEEVQA